MPKEAYLEQCRYGQHTLSPDIIAVENGTYILGP